MNIRSCAICYLEKTEEECMLIPNCGHEFCITCLKALFLSIIDSKEFYRIKCPYCENKDLDLIAKSVLTETEFEKFDREKYYYILSLDSNIRWCPAPDCKGFSLINGTKKLECNACQCFFCMDCLQKWQPNHRCEKANDFLEYMKNMGIKACPGCKNVVEKVSGCASMRCRCGTSFCMICGNVINENHDALKCLLELEKPSYLIIIGMIFSLILFPFHAGWYMIRIGSFEFRDANGIRIHKCQSICLYSLILLFSPIMTLIIIISLGGYMIFNSNGKNINSSLPVSKWFWPFKPLVWGIVYILVTLFLILAYQIFNLYLTIRGLLTLVKKIYLIF